MSRWHAKSCTEPEVCLHQGTPSCRNCNKTALTLLQDVKPISVSASRSIPPDEPPGSLNLHWPPSIRWEGTPTEPPKTFEQPTKVQDEAGYQRHESESQSGAIGSTNSYIYLSPLRPHEIRLICLGGEDDINAPVHLTLEIHDQEECPEYETVSYTWTGEDGDANLSEALFIGPYWDISFQTRNVLSLLKYLRPRHGLRFIWIDAICINQVDVAGRTSQVANMGHIYSRCSRVVVWLGHDLVQDSPKRYRRRRPLQEIRVEIGNQTMIEGILRRRYFSRMWVIQEMVLAPMSIFPIGQVDYVATHNTPNELLQMLGCEKWDTVKFGWLQYMHDITKFDGQNLFDVLERISVSEMRATDPRDKIFSVLGLLQSSTSVTLKPDYSLSCRISSLEPWHTFYWTSNMTIFWNMPQDAKLERICHHGYLHGRTFGNPRSL
ncbi:hypothetical protein PG988_011095 [Apiospora saccharicola]